MARKHRSMKPSGYSLLLADDDADYLDATRLLLESEGHEVLVARNGPETLSCLRERHVDLLLLDYFMPGMTGEEVVQHLREFDGEIQVVLQTGYANEQPPREMLRRLDIQGYYDKSEGPEKLLLWTDAGLKAATTVGRLNRARRGLEYILRTTPELHRMQPFSDLLETVLTRAVGLAAAVEHHSGSREPPSGFLAVLRDDSELAIRATTGDFSPTVEFGAAIDASERELVIEALGAGNVRVGPRSTVIPLRVGELTIGVTYLARAVPADDVELYELFANQATVAIHNVQLYELAALDPLTGVHARRFFDQWLRKEVRTAFRAQRPLSVLMVDIDDLETLNERAGHLAGDQALATLGRSLRHAIRDNDVVGRWGGDEFSVILPQTGRLGAQRVAERVLELLAETVLATPSGQLRLRCSIGMSVLEPPQSQARDVSRPTPQSYFQDIALALLENAEGGLHQARSKGGGCVAVGPATAWAPYAR